MQIPDALLDTIILSTTNEDISLALIHIYMCIRDSKVGQVVLEGHIKHCVRDGIENGDADKTIESFTKAVERFANMT